MNVLKEKLSTAQDCGKAVTAVCSEEDEQMVDAELQELAGKWNDLNTEVYARKHQLEDALLQLGGRGGEGHCTRRGREGRGTTMKGRGWGKGRGRGRRGGRYIRK